MRQETDESAGRKQLEYMETCLRWADSFPAGPARDNLLQMAWAFHRDAIRLQRNSHLIAESRDLLAQIEQANTVVAVHSNDR